MSRATKTSTATTATSTSPPLLELSIYLNAQVLRSQAQRQRTRGRPFATAHTGRKDQPSTVGGALARHRAARDPCHVAPGVPARAVEWSWGRRWQPNWLHADTPCQLDWVPVFVSCARSAWRDVQQERCAAGGYLSQRLRVYQTCQH